MLKMYIHPSFPKKKKIKKKKNARKYQSPR